MDGNYMKNKNMKIGMRTIKTGLAVSLSVFLAESFGLNSPLFVGIGAISTMQSSVSESFSMGKNRILGTIIGAFVAVIMSYVLPSNIFILGIGIVLVIHMLNLLGWKKSINLSVIVFVAVFLNHDEAMIPYAIHRVFDTFVGIMVGVLINYFIAAPNHDKLFRSIVIPMIQQGKELTYDIVIGKKKIELNNFKEQLTEVIKLQELMESETKLKVVNKNDLSNSMNLSNRLIQIDNDLSSLVMMNYIATITPANLSAMEDLYMIHTFWEERSVLNQEDIIFNYHLQRLIENLKICESIKASPDKG